MNPLYDIGIQLYSLGARIGALRSPKIKKMIEGQREAVQKINAVRCEVAPDGFDVWFHAASLGEFEQARPMIERLNREQSNLKILLTFFSPSGYEVRKNYHKVACVAYLPFDTPRNVDKFLAAARPKMAIFVKYEFWGNYLEQLRSHKIPTYIISAIFRPGQAFFKWYGGMMRNMLGNFTHLYVQDERSQKLLAGIGISNATITGDTRFDRVTDVMRTTVEFPLIENWIEASGVPVIIAGSSWQPDEDCYIPYLNAHPGLHAIIAPHEFDENRLALLQKQLNGKSVLFSEAEKTGVIPPDPQAVIIDSFGKLSSLYRYGQAAIIGGGFGAGIHNINEAAVYGMPVIFGPRHQKFKEAADLIACGGGKEYASAQKLADILDAFFTPAPSPALIAAGKSAAEYIKANIGATDLIYKQIFKN